MSSISRSDRICGMIWGLFVGDAASLGAHWVYDLEALDRAYPSGVQGFEPPGLAQYHAGKVSGDQTHYGDAAVLLLESIAQRGGFNEADFARRFRAFFRDPAIHSYRDHATKETLKHWEEKPDDFQNGADDDQPGAVVRVPAVVAAYSENRDSLADSVNHATRVTHVHQLALGAAQLHAELLSQLLAGSTFASSLGALSAELFLSQGDSPRSELSQLVEAAVNQAGESVRDATLHFGQGCPLVKTLPSAIHAAFVHSGNSADPFRGAILDTIGAGGDSAARASMIGAWLGAEHGISAIPADWLEKLTQRARIQVALDQLLTKGAAS